MMPLVENSGGETMIEAGIFFLLTILFLALVRGYRTLAVVVFLLCFTFILFDFLYHATSPLSLSL
jgi:hypothetical protein